MQASRTLEILEEDYAYSPSFAEGAHLSLFSSAIRTASQQGGNDYDAAAIFMASICEMLCHSTKLDAEVRQLVRRNVNMMLASFDRMNTNHVRELVQGIDRVAKGVGA